MFDFAFLLVKEAFSSNVQLMHAWWYWPVVGISFYLYYTFEFALNGGDSRPRAVISGFWEEFLWNAPGATRRRAKYIRELVGDTGSGCIVKWCYEEIREKNLYGRVGWSVLPGPFMFYGRITAFAFLPISLVILSLLIVVSLACAALYSLWCWITGTV